LNLKAYDVVMLNYSSRWNYMDPQQHVWSPEAFQALYDYVREGGGLVAYHSSFTWGRDIPEYKRLVGAVMEPGSRDVPRPERFRCTWSTARTRSRRACASSCGPTTTTCTPT
jgi:hypothetical protein